MKLKLCLVATASFILGTYAQSKHTVAKIKKDAPAIMQEHADKLWHDAFHAGYTSAVDDPSVAYKHYTEFKDRLDESQV